MIFFNRVIAKSSLLGTVLVEYNFCSEKEKMSQ